MLEVTFKFTNSELYKGTVAIARSRFIMRAYRFVGIISVLIFLFILYSDISHNLAPPFYAIIFIIFGLYLTFVVEIASKQMAAKYIKTNAQITEQTTYIFEEKNYQLTGESFSTRMDYDKLYEVNEVDDFILLRVSEGTAHTLPKRAFSDEQFNRLKNIIRSVKNLKSTFRA